VNELIKWSALQNSPTNLSAAGFYHEDAVSLMDRAHYGRAD
jgi:hypothetical protein